jgi:pimeloyl-ACP methyl ester carboxylesterase
MNDSGRPTTPRASGPGTPGCFRNEEARERFLAAYREAMEKLPAPRTVYDIPTSYGTARVYRFGEQDGAPIVLLPGRTASTPMWQPNIGELSSERPVYSVDVIGEPGMSTQMRPIKDGVDQSRWLEEAFAYLDLQSIHLVGVSMGGWTAFNQVLRAPERIASISLIDPALVFARLSWKVVLVSLAAIGPLPQRVRLKLLSWIAGGLEVTEDEPTAKLIASGMRDCRSTMPAPAYPTDAQIRSITVPVLVLLAGRSIIHNAAKAESRARSLLQHARVERWPDASHAINGEFPERVNRTVLDFVAGPQTR